MPEAHIYRPADRPEVEVLVDGTWYVGELRAWFPTADGGWNVNVQYGLRVAENRLDTFPENHSRGSSGQIALALWGGGPRRSDPAAPTW